ncbi:MAG: D-glycero-beta-D-manno-heptose 1-phosphate adenylyltransferase [Sedimentisphaerales bacterium]|nr:D-glycero-beta-D-manno-heptose 1-phosphate adenylyltransferase [Sedimentisphaerales bacterium]
MSDRLIELLKNVGATRVALVGDFMLDHYTYGNAERLSPEAPVVVLNVIERQQRPGGAGSVAADLSALGAKVICLGAIGDDANGRLLRDKLAILPGVDIAGLLVDPHRPTTSKERIIGLAQHRHRQQLMRIDEEQRNDMTAELGEQLIERFCASLLHCDVVCLQDYGKGVLDDINCQAIIKAAQQAGKRVIVDPAATAKYERYRGAWMIKPNRRELGLAAGMAIDGEPSWRTAAAKLAEDYDLTYITVTLDKEGAYLYQRLDASQPRGERLATRARTVYDVTGAGDMMLAMLGLLAGGSFTGVAAPTAAEMVRLANVAGGLEVERFGSTAISRDEILDELVRERHGQRGKYRSLDGLITDLSWHRQQNHKVVFTNGCFDILHPGHIKLLHFAKAQGDVLIVAINSDRSVRALKGSTRPILKQDDRAALIGALEAVDYVIIFDEETPQKIIEAVCPDVLIKGTDWQGNVVGQEWVEAHGGQVVLMPLEPGKSTTNIIAQVLERYNTGGNEER